jgi:hypothetical protein
MTSKSKKRYFDCIAIKRQAQEQIYEDIKGLSPEEEIEYFRKAVNASPFKKWWEKAQTTTPVQVEEAS